MRAAILAVLLAATVALTGCAADDPPPATDPAGVREVEDIVNDLDSVVGSAESEVETGND